MLGKLKLFEGQKARRARAAEAERAPGVPVPDFSAPPGPKISKRQSMSSSGSSAGSRGSQPTPAPRSSSLGRVQAYASTGDLRLRAPLVRSPPSAPTLTSLPPRPSRPRFDDNLVTIIDSDETGDQVPDLIWGSAALKPAPAAYDILARAWSDTGQSSLASSLYRSTSDASTAWSERPGHHRRIPRALSGVQQDFFLPHLHLQGVQRATLLISLTDEVFVACQRTYRRGLEHLVAERLASRWRDDIDHAAQLEIYSTAARVQAQPGGQGLLRLARFARWALGEAITEPACVEARVIHIEALGGEEISALLTPCGLNQEQEDLLAKHCGSASNAGSVGSLAAAWGARSPSSSTWSGAPI